MIIFVLIFTLGLLIYTIFYLSIPLFIPMLIGFLFLTISTRFSGHSWRQIKDYSIKGIKNIVPVLPILLLIGALIAIWYDAGIISALIYYGLNFVVLKYYLVTVFLITTVISLVLGSSVAAASTVGIAMIGIAKLLNIPIPIVAGAIVSGAFIGDRTSPVSSSAQLTAAITETKYNQNFPYYFRTLWPVFILTSLIYLIIGLGLDNGNNIQPLIKEVQTNILKELNSISLVLLVPPLLVIIAAYFKITTKLNFLIAIFLGIILALFVQKDSLLQLFSTSIFGFREESTQHIYGGIFPMLKQILLIIVSGAFYGVLEHSGAMERLLEKILRSLNSTKRLILATMLFSFLGGIIAATQAMAIIAPGIILKKYYNELKLPKELLASLIADSGIVLAGIIPWNLNALILAITLNVAVFKYTPYSYFLLILPIYSLLFNTFKWKENGDNIKIKIIKDKQALLWKK